MLAPNKKLAEEILIDFYSAFISVKMAAFSISYSNVFTLTPTPDYLKSLTVAFKSAKQLSDDWSVRKEPAIISTIPQSFITYSNRIGTVGQLIAGGASKEQVIESLQWLKKHLDNNATQTQSLQDEISTFGNQFKSFRKTIDNSILAANKTIQSDRTAVEELQEQISALYQKIAQEQQLSSDEMSSIATTGAGLAFTLISYAFDVATVANPAFPFIGVGVAVIGLTYASIVAAINDEKVVENLKSINKLKAKLIKDDQAIAVLSNMNTMLQNIEKMLLQIHSAVDLSPLWSTQSESLDQAIQELKVYDGTDFKSLLPIKTFPEAVDSWQGISKTAFNIQKSDTGLQAGKPIKVDNSN